MRQMAFRASACLIALVLADLAVSGHDRQLEEAQVALVEELKRQILDDGGHVSRSASVLADLVLDLLPLGQCFHSRGRKAPEEISVAVKKSLSFLRFMRLGDGMLARFNGVSTGSPATLATVLGYSGGNFDVMAAAPDVGLCPARARTRPSSLPTSVLRRRSKSRQKRRPARCRSK